VVRGRVGEKPPRLRGSPRSKWRRWRVDFAMTRAARGKRSPCALGSALLLPGLSLLLAGCGSGLSPALKAFCAQVPTLTSLRVSRTSLPQNDYQFSFPAEVTSTDSSAVRQLARDVCRLHTFPKGTFNCPEDFGIDYRVDFMAEGRMIRQIEADASGCWTVTGFGGPALSPNFKFWNDLAALLGAPALRVNCDPLLGTAPINSPSNCGAILSDT
jgi:hypothetical protein